MGLATRMWNFAQGMHKNNPEEVTKPIHSSHITDMGKAWKKSLPSE